MGAQFFHLLWVPFSIDTSLDVGTSHSANFSPKVYGDGEQKWAPAKRTPPTSKKCLMKKCPLKKCRYHVQIHWFLNKHFKNVVFIQITIAGTNFIFFQEALVWRESAKSVTDKKTTTPNTAVVVPTNVCGPSVGVSNYYRFHSPFCWNWWHFHLCNSVVSITPWL